MKFYKPSTNKGFTLIELLVVIAIIAMLSAIIVGPIQSARKKARDAKRAADLQGLKTALESYFDDNGAYPSSSSGGYNSTCSGWGSYSETNVIPGLIPNYISKLPQDPLNPSGTGYATNCLLYLGNYSGTTGYKVMIYQSTEPPASSSQFYLPPYQTNSWSICSGGLYCTSW